MEQKGQRVLVLFNAVEIKQLIGTEISLRFIVLSDVSPNCSICCSLHHLITSTAALFLNSLVLVVGVTKSTSIYLALFNDEGSVNYTSGYLSVRYCLLLIF